MSIGNTPVIADIDIRYVYVDGNMETPPSSSGSEQYDVCSETVSFSKAEEWEKELMEDPKVRISYCMLNLSESMILLRNNPSIICPNHPPFIESSCSLRTFWPRPKGRPHPTFHNHCRYPIFQYQDIARRCSHHQSAK